MTGRTTLKQALREYPSDVRTAAARVRDEWRKLTWPRLVVAKPQPTDFADRSPDEQRARGRKLSQSRWLVAASALWVGLVYIVALAAAVHPPTGSQAVKAFAFLAAFTAIFLAYCLYIGYCLNIAARYGEWVTTPPPKP